MLTDERLMAAKALLEDGTLTVREIARQLGVSEATIYKNIPNPRMNFPKA